MRISRLLGAEGRAQARRAVEARVLPRDVARFYRRALAAAVSARDSSTLAAIPNPRELLALLEVARGCDSVIELGRDDPVTPVALAIDDVRRHVTAFRPAGGLGGGNYSALAGSSTYARVEFRERPLEHVPVRTDHPACLAVIDGSSDRRRVEAAFESCSEAVRPGGLVVLRRHGDPTCGGVGEAIAALALDGRSSPGRLYLWRKPVDEPHAPETVKPARAPRVPWLPLVLALVGIAVGVGAGVLVTQGGSKVETLVSTPTTPAAVPPAQGSSPAPERTSRSRERRSRERRSRSRARKAERRARRNSQTPQTGPRARDTFRFSGNAPRTIDRITLRRDSILSWSTRGGQLEIKSEAFELNASSSRGQTTIPRGTYRRLRVRSSTPWTLEIVPP